MILAILPRPIELARHLAARGNAARSSASTALVPRWARVGESSIVAAPGLRWFVVCVAGG
jgi:hypothetical protein